MTVKRRINIIIYQPGFAGHLMKCLFSLALNTVRLLPHHNKSPDSPAIRASDYSFRNASAYRHWCDFHMDFDSSFDEEDPSVSGIYCIADHPLHIWNSIKRHAANESSELCYFKSELSYSPFNNYWLVRTKEIFNNFPKLHLRDIESERLLTEKFSPEPISVDAFLSLDTWHEEYSRINKLMGLQDVPEANEFYLDWYNIRVRPLIEEFKQITPDVIKIYSDIRKNHDMFGQPSEPRFSFWDTQVINKS